MDNAIVYRKTPAGEEAVRHRTRLMQRNLRMVLILVDGISTVADLAQKTGNAQLTESALQELEQGGFIAPRLESAGLLDESKRRVRDLGAAALEKAAGLAFGGAQVRDEPVAQAEQASEATPALPAQDKKEEPREEPVAVPAGSAPVVVSEPVAQTRPTFDLGPADSTPPGTLVGVDEGAGTGVFTHMPRLSPQLELQPAGEAENKPAALPPITQDSPRDKSQSSVRRMLFRPREELPDLREVPGRRSAWLKVVAGVVVLLIAAVLLGVVFFPHERYRAEAEARLGELCGQAAHVANLRVSLTPNFGLILEGVRIGAEGSALRIEFVRLRPEISSLFSDRLVFDEVSLSGLELSPPSVFSSAPVLARLAASDGLGVRSLRLEKTTLELAGARLDDFDGEMLLAAAEQTLRLRNGERSVSVELRFEPNRSQALPLSLEVYGWRPGAGSPVLVDSLNAKGVLNARQLDFSSIDLRMLDGAVGGALSILNVNDARPALRGVLTFERINAQRLGDALGQASLLQGEVAGDMRFSVRAEKWGELLAGLEAEGQIVSRRGQVRGIDLAEAVRRTSGSPVQGGVTPYEQLTLRYRATPGNLQYADIQLASGLMQSRGALEVGAGGKLSGRLEMQMRGSVNQSRVPVAVSGTAAVPSVQLSR